MAELRRLTGKRCHLCLPLLGRDRDFINATSHTAIEFALFFRSQNLVRHIWPAANTNHRRCNCIVHTLSMIVLARTDITQDRHLITFSLDYVFIALSRSQSADRKSPATIYSLVEILMAASDRNVRLSLFDMSPAFDRVDFPILLQLLCKLVLSLTALCSTRRRTQHVEYTAINSAVRCITWTSVWTIAVYPRHSVAL